MLTPAQAHFQHVMALRAGTAAENEDIVARTAHEQVLHRLRPAQQRIKGVQQKRQRPRSSVKCCRVLQAG